MDRYEFLLGMAGIIMTGTVATTIVVTIGRLIAQRRSAQAIPPGSMAQLDERLSRIEQAIDSMAVEVERVSEGQRFTSKLLADRAQGRERVGG